MRLKSLKLAGFKSFANATTFTFPHGITAIVGPNGCGKSNVIDAIRWVLGETSAKQLRGGAMSDVIFAGTQDKAAKSVASVELTFEHTQDEQTGIRHEFNLYQELSVRRQVNLEGRSDYFINSTRCRRRDVVDVFLGTGLGARSYAVIEQGMIGRIIESSPLQLREFIEEAAGVSRYQARRAETQKKLEVTQDNLARLQDMQSELVRQHKTLSKQATSAERYQALNETLAEVEQQLAIQQLYQAKQHQQQQKQHYDLSTAQLTTLQSAYESIKVKQEQLTATINQEQWLKDEAQSKHYEQQLSYQQAEHRLNDSEAKSTQIQQQLTSLEAKHRQALDEIETLTVEQSEQRLALERLRPQHSDLEHKRESYQRDELPLQRALQAAQDRLSELQGASRHLEQQHALKTQATQRLQLSAEKWQRRQQQWQTLWQQLNLSMSTVNNKDAQSLTVDTNDNELLGQIKTATATLQHISRQQESVSERLDSLKPHAQALKQRLTEQQRLLSEHEKRHALLAGEYETLHSILHPKVIESSKAQHKDIESAAKYSIEDQATLEAYQQLPISTLREQIELSDLGQRHALSLDKVLGLWLDSHVCVDNQANPALSHHPDHTNDSAQSSPTLWYALAHQLPELLTYTQTQNQAQNQAQISKEDSENKLSVISGSAHSLWFNATTDTNAQTSYLDTLPMALKDTVLPLVELIRRPALALWQQGYLYLAPTMMSLQQKNEAFAAVLKALPSSAWLLTPEGWLINRYGTINLNKHLLNKHLGVSGEQASSQYLTQRLQQRQRLAELDTLLDDSDAQTQAQQQTIKQHQQELDALTVSLEETLAQNEQLARDKSHHERQLSTHQATYERQQADVTRLQAEQVTLDQEQQELTLEKTALEDEQQQIDQKRAALTPQIAEAQQEQQQLQAKRSELGRARQADDKRWQALQLDMQKSELRLEHTLSRLSSATQAKDQFKQNEQALTEQLVHYQQQLPELKQAVASIKAVRDEQQALLSSLEASMDALKQIYTQQHTELEMQLTQLQAFQSKLSIEATELALSEARLKDSSDKAHDALQHYYQNYQNYQIINKDQNSDVKQSVSVSSLLTDFITHERKVRPEKITELQDERTRLEQQISKIGPVNLAAVAELAQVNERLEPLAQQTEDIAASMDTLIGAIASIDETTKTLFLQTLAAVNSELSTLFAKVFGGGQASLTLNDEDMPVDTVTEKRHSEQWRAGLTLMAQPKGKRNSRLAVLSGGEKTLTALSLIFAIFKQHPAPFCVLDEVDAPLDDANVERFTSLIHELAGELQFIFISHNKLSMQIADELKGITMPSPGISTLVSVSLDEAVQYLNS